MNNGFHNYQVDVSGERVGENIPVEDVGVTWHCLICEEIIRAADMSQAFESWLVTAERNDIRKSIRRGNERSLIGAEISLQIFWWTLIYQKKRKCLWEQNITQQKVNIYSPFIFYNLEQLLKII